jgi:hypothetical protein
MPVSGVRSRTASGTATRSPNSTSGGWARSVENVRSGVVVRWAADRWVSAVATPSGVGGIVSRWVGTERRVRSPRVTRVGSEKESVAVSTPAWNVASPSKPTSTSGELSARTTYSLAGSCMVVSSSGSSASPSHQLPSVASNDTSGERARTLTILVGNPISRVRPPSRRSERTSNSWAGDSSVHPRTDSVIDAPSWLVARIPVSRRSTATAVSSVSNRGLVPPMSVSTEETGRTQKPAARP